MQYNTSRIIEQPFWQRTMQNPKATYAYLNQCRVNCPGKIEKQAICIDGDIGEILTQL